MIEATRTPAGGWKRDQLAAWGVPWPPPKGWKDELAERWQAPTTKGTTTGYTYDSADRLSASGYVYDAFGRTTTLPNSQIGYYANDLVHQQTARGQRQIWQLDAGQRFRSWTVEENTDGPGPRRPPGPTTTTVTATTPAGSPRTRHRRTGRRHVPYEPLGPRHGGAEQPGHCRAQHGGADLQSHQPGRRHERTTGDQVGG